MSLDEVPSAPEAASDEDSSQHLPVRSRAAGGPSGSRVVLAVTAAWVLSLGFDFLLHGGLLARLYTGETSPSLVAPEEAFRRIPFGYLAFLILTLSLYWLLSRLGIRGAIAGLRYATAAGVVVWGAFAVGLYSISTVPWPILVAWWFGQALELGAAGAVIGAALGGMRFRRLWALVMVIVIACIAVTVVLQSVGWAPAVRR
jgi:hypothetical protein